MHGKPASAVENENENSMNRKIVNKLNNSKQNKEKEAEDRIAIELNEIQASSDDQKHEQMYKNSSKNEESLDTTATITDFNISFISETDSNSVSFEDKSIEYCTDIPQLHLLTKSENANSAELQTSSDSTNSELNDNITHLCTFRNNNQRMNIGGKEWKHLTMKKKKNISPTVKYHGAEIMKHMKTDEYVPSIALRNIPKYRISSEKYFGLFRSYVRQDWQTVNVDEPELHELRAEWIELFFDLIFVAGIVRLASQVTKSVEYYESLTSNTANVYNSHSTYDYIYIAFAQFAILTLLWSSQMIYNTHFINHQWIDDALKLLFMGSVLALCVFIKDDADYHIAFLYMYCVCKCIEIVQYLKVGLIPRARNFSIWKCIECISSILYCLMIAIFVPLTIGQSSVRASQYFLIYFGLYFMSQMFLILEWCLPAQWDIAIPIHVSHVTERQGMFIMLILGESLISLLTTNMEDLDFFAKKKSFNINGALPDVLVVAFVVIGFFISYCIARLYFECQPSEEQILSGDHNHALRTSAVRGRLYMYSHHVLYISLLGWGIGTKLIVKHMTSDERRFIDVGLPGYSIIIAIIALNMIRLSHPQLIGGRIIWSVRLLFIAFMLLMTSFGAFINHGILTVVFLFCVTGLLLVDVEGHQKKKEKKNELKNRAMRHSQQLSLSNRQNAESCVGVIRTASAVGRM